MTTQEREVIRKALAALEFDGFAPEDAMHHKMTARAIEALRQSLEAPEAEPVAYTDCDQPNGVAWCLSAEGLRDITPLYAAPQPAQQPLTDGQIAHVFDSAKRELCNFAAPDQQVAFRCAIVRAVEAAHGIAGDGP